MKSSKISSWIDQRNNGAVISFTWPFLSVIENGFVSHIPDTPINRRDKTPKADPLLLRFLLGSQLHIITTSWKRLGITHDIPNLLMHTLCMLEVKKQWMSKWFANSASLEHKQHMFGMTKPFLSIKIRIINKKEQAQELQAPMGELSKNKSVPLKGPNKEVTSEKLRKMRGPRKHQTYSPLIQLPGRCLLSFKDTGILLIRPKAPTHNMRDTLPQNGTLWEIKSPFYCQTK